MQCPICKDTQLIMAERQGIEIDYCPNCRGVWLDRGELDKIIERAMSEYSPRSASPPSTYPAETPDYRGHHPPDDDYYKHRHPKKKRRFLEDLFDFD